MKDKDEVRTVAQKQATLQKIREGIERDGGGGFILTVAYEALPESIEIKKLCESYERAWEWDKDEPEESRTEAETKLTIYSLEESEWIFLMLSAMKGDVQQTTESTNRVTHTIRVR